MRNNFLIQGRAPAILLALTLSACGTTVQRAVTAPRRVVPSEALVPCPAKLPALPNNFSELSAEDAVRVVLQEKTREDALYFDCSRKHARLKEYVEDEK